jgi:hypothetical protein
VLADVSADCDVVEVVVVASTESVVPEVGVVGSDDESADGESFDAGSVSARAIPSP